eukprot:43291-Eustigmatos_ZCMA.PRE.1
MDRLLQTQTTSHCLYKSSRSSWRSSPVTCRVSGARPLAVDIRHQKVTGLYVVMTHFMFLSLWATTLLPSRAYSWISRP